MIGWTITGFPRPVGSAFRQRTIYAERGYRDNPVPWVVSVIDTLAGPVIEARNHVNPQAIVADDLSSHSDSGMQDVIAKAKALLDKDGWKDRAVEPCSVAGCDRGRPMWATGGYHDTECLPCSLRTVLVCRECGAPDQARYVGRERLLREQLCFGCDLWTTRLTDINGEAEFARLRDKAHAGPTEPLSVFWPAERARLRERCAALGISTKGAA